MSFCLKNKAVVSLSLSKVNIEEHRLESLSERMGVTGNLGFITCYDINILSPW